MTDCISVKRKCPCTKARGAKCDGVSLLVAHMYLMWILQLITNRQAPIQLFVSSHISQVLRTCQIPTHTNRNLTLISKLPCQEKNPSSCLTDNYMSHKRCNCVQPRSCITFDLWHKHRMFQSWFQQAPGLGVSYHNIKPSRPDPYPEPHGRVGPSGVRQRGSRSRG